MSKSELKRPCAQNPVEMAEKILELEQRVKVLTDFVRDVARNFDCDSDAHKYGTLCRACDADRLLKATPQQTAEQIERWHVEWMKTLSSPHMSQGMTET